MGSATKSERDAAFTAFVHQASPSLLRTAWLLTGDHRDLHYPLRRQRQMCIRDRAYTRRVLVNERTDRWRRHGAEVALAAVPETTSPGPESVTDERDAVVRLLARLPDQQRRVVVLRYYVDLSEQATADALNISVGSVKSAASRGLATLRAELASTTSEGVVQ